MPRFRELQAAIQAALPDAVVTEKIGARGCFEVTVDGVLVHSKLDGMGYPNVAELVKKITAM